MAKKALSVMLLMASVTVFAASQSSQPAKKHKYSNYEQNKPTVGSRQQSSDQQFGQPQITGKKGQKPVSNVAPGQANSPTVGSRQQSSDQQFGQPKITGTKGQKPQSADGGELNSPTVGGRQSSSDQIFGNPDSPTNQ